MKRSYLYGIIALIIFMFISVEIGIFVYKKNAEKRTIIPSIIQENPQQLLHWEDPAGLAFNYPDGLSIDTHEEDTANYAHIEFTHPDHPGNVIIWAKDAPMTEDGVFIIQIEDWLKLQTDYDISSSLDSELASVSAKKLRVQSDEHREAIVGVYDTLVWIVEAYLEDESFWRPIYTTITDSFSFITPVYAGDPPTEEYVASDVPQASGGGFDEVEVLE